VASKAWIYKRHPEKAGIDLTPYTGLKIVLKGLDKVAKYDNVT
jgi:hypothetical protein